jgi:DMSO/TMAO reductase YedYZ molybdopterin-dependent catalytic subunit
VPTQFGYKSVKWVTQMEVTDKLVRGYWEKRGYPSNAELKARPQHWGPAPQDTPVVGD